MLTFEDCLGLCDLSEEEIEAILEHEHVPEIVALEMGNYLVHTDEGVPMLRQMIVDDIKRAEEHGHLEHALHLRMVLRHFIRTHPQFEALKAARAARTAGAKR